MIAESYWVFEDFASETEKRRSFASLTTFIGYEFGYMTKLLVWTESPLIERRAKDG